MAKVIQEMSYMSVEHVFVDTNILVYAHDSDSGIKHNKACKLIKSFYDKPYPPAISTQVLQELVSTLSKNKVDKKTINRLVSIYYNWEIILYEHQFFVFYP